MVLVGRGVGCCSYCCVCLVSVVPLRVVWVLFSFHVVSVAPLGVWCLLCVRAVVCVVFAGVWLRLARCVCSGGLCWRVFYVCVVVLFKCVVVGWCLYVC